MTLKTLLAAGIVTSLIAIGSCTSSVVRYVTVPLDCPVRPVLPSLSEEDLAPLSQDAFERLAERDQKRRHYAEELEALCKSTQPTP